MSATRIEIKICGLTTPEAASACAAAGADAIGMVFHPPSPRNLSVAQAHAIATALPSAVAKIGVFVQQTAEEILQIAAQVGLTGIQLHGAPDGHSHETFTLHKLHVVQMLCGRGANLLTQAGKLPSSTGILVECGRGALPGGNGTPWNWGEALVLREIRPFAVAGGLDPANVGQALAVSSASGVDVSSGVEAAPGVKDLGKVSAFIAAVRTSGAKGCGRVFKAGDGA